MSSINKINKCTSDATDDIPIFHILFATVFPFIFVTVVKYADYNSVVRINPIYIFIG